MSSCGRRQCDPRAAVALVALFLLVSCDVSAGVHVRRSLAPTPAPDCVNAALGASPLVASVIPPSEFPPDESPATGARPEPAVYRLQVRDSASRGGMLEGRLTLDPGPADSTRLSVVFVEHGPTTFMLDKERARQLAALGTRIARTVRDVCAPTSPDDETCRIEGFGPTRRCHAA